jgi:hypothetical protein
VAAASLIADASVSANNQLCLLRYVNSSRCRRYKTDRAEEKCFRQKDWDESGRSESDGKNSGKTPWLPSGLGAPCSLFEIFLRVLEHQAWSLIMVRSSMQTRHLGFIP